MGRRGRNWQAPWTTHPGTVLLAGFEPEKGDGSGEDGDSSPSSIAKS